MQFNTMPHFWFDYVREHPVEDKDAEVEVDEVEVDDDLWDEDDELENLF